MTAQIDFPAFDHQEEPFRIILVEQFNRFCGIFIQRPDRIADGSSVAGISGDDGRFCHSEKFDCFRSIFVQGSGGIVRFRTVHLITEMFEYKSRFQNRIQGKKRVLVFIENLKSRFFRIFSGNGFFQAGYAVAHDDIII